MFLGMRGMGDYAGDVVSSVRFFVQIHTQSFRSCRVRAMGVNGNLALTLTSFLSIRGEGGPCHRLPGFDALCGVLEISPLAGARSK